MSQAQVAGDSGVRIRQPLGEREPGARGRQRRETKMLEIPRGADVPRIRYDETAALVQHAERLATVAARQANVRCLRPDGDIGSRDSLVTIDHGDPPVQLVFRAFAGKTGQPLDL